MILLKNSIMLALDVDSDQQAFSLLDQIGDKVGAIKVGPRLNLKYGATFIEKTAKYAPVFVDHKYFDITSTVLASVQATFDAGATFATVHALNGIETLSQLYLLELKLNKIRSFKILAVTILTSWTKDQFPENFQDLTVEEHVSSLVEMVMRSGLSGIVCSGYELGLIRRIEDPTSRLFKVVPGIRVEEDIELNTQDQKRVMTPAQAMESGANALVIGRSILNSKDPRQTVQKILESI
jgi:orotidine-5'-phosphate decarboxylase